VLVTSGRDGRKNPNSPINADRGAPGEKWKKRRVVPHFARDDMFWDGGGEAGWVGHATLWKGKWKFGARMEIGIEESAGTKTQRDGNS
jgi:hypothetical protein